MQYGNDCHNTRIPQLFCVILGVGLLASGCIFDQLLPGWTTTTPSASQRFAAMDQFSITDPYEPTGTWYKVQLHMHTEGSLDSRWPVQAALQTYADLGYDFVAITDHDVITIPDEVPAGLITIPGEENTLTDPVFPMGQHAVFLFIEQKISNTSVSERFAAVVEQGGIVSIAHPHWTGNLGSGRWESWHLLTAPHFALMEIYNPHSDTGKDEAFWHDTLVLRGMEQPVWAVAVDDAHFPWRVNQGWTMAKADDHSLPALKEALLRGSLYPTTGLSPDFWVDGDVIHVQAQEPVQIEFIDGHGDVVHQVAGASTESYTPSGDEGFVRIRLRDPATGARAWSQPFWLVEN